MLYINQIKNYLKRHWKLSLFLAILIIGICIYIGSVINRAQSAEKAAQKAQSMTAEQAQNVNDLQNRLNVSESTASQLKDAIAKAQSNTVRPQVSFTVQAPDTTTAVKDVTQRINDNDASLPPAAIEKTDRTIVADQPDNKDYPVGVYKINLKKNYYAGTGVGVNAGKVYIPVALQRNYDKAHAVEFQANIDTQGKVDGGQIMWKVGF